jgi:hypothetical protein
MKLIRPANLCHAIPKGKEHNYETIRNCRSDIFVACFNLSIFIRRPFGALIFAFYVIKKIYTASAVKIRNRKAAFEHLKSEMN